MNRETGQRPEHCAGAGEHRHARPTSYWMQDPERVFKELALKAGDCFLDLGCGQGDYALHAADIVGPSGRVFALDQSKELLDGLKAQAADKGAANLTTAMADITARLPLKDRCADVCLIANVLHSTAVAPKLSEVFAEVARVLKPGGRMAVMEIKKEETPFGPPLRMRLSADEIERAAAPLEFVTLNVADLGHNYLAQFRA